MQKMDIAAFGSDESIAGPYNHPIYGLSYSYHFWEAWRVTSGQSDPIAVGRGGNDFNQMPGWNEGMKEFEEYRFGRWVVTGIVRYYDEPWVLESSGIFHPAPLDPYNYDFQLTEHNPPFGPWFWKDASDGTVHDIVIEWDTELEFARATVTWGDEQGPKNTRTVYSP